MDRRSFLGFLAAAGLVGLSGCTSTAPTPMPTSSGTAPAPLPSDDDELRRITADAELQLIALYGTAILGAAPELAEQLRTLQEQHVAHAQRLLPGQPVSLDPVVTSPPLGSSAAAQSSEAAEATDPSAASAGAGPAEPSASPTAETPDLGASATPSTSVGPADPTATPSPSPRAVLVSLRRAELAALDQRRDACARASGPELVRSLCLIAASEAQHADVLAGLRAGLPR